MMAKNNDKKGRKVVRSVFSNELYQILLEICEKLGLSESDVLRMAFIDYAQKIREKLG